MPENASQPDTVTSVADLRGLPVGTTMHYEGHAEDPLAGVVKVAAYLYATPGAPGKVWSYHHEDEVTGLIQSDGTPEGVEECSWFPLVVDDRPTAPASES